VLIYEIIFFIDFSPVSFVLNCVVF